jgi:hypothetical protein
MVSFYFAIIERVVGPASAHESVPDFEAWNYRRGFKKRKID